MLDRDQLETFATVAEAHSFERAATLLNITRGAVSQRIKALEESLTTVLLVREKPVAPTAAGEILLRHVKALRLLEGATLNELKPQAGPHVPVPLAIAVNADSLATWFTRALWELLLRRQVALEIVTDDQDHTSGRLARGEVRECIQGDTLTHRILLDEETLVDMPATRRLIEDRAFERQVRGLGRPGDVFLAISTSGRSPNVLQALKAAREIGVTTVGFTGDGPREMSAYCDHYLAAPSSETPLIQQIHMVAAHAICGLVERDLFGAAAAMMVVKRPGATAALAIHTNDAE